MSDRLGIDLGHRTGPEEPATVELAAPPPPAPASRRRSRPAGPPAVLDGSRRTGLPRLLVAGGAVAVAALAVVALFRADGPLDPPTEVAGGARPTVARAEPVPGVDGSGSGVEPPTPAAPTVRG